MAIAVAMVNHRDRSALTCTPYLLNVVVDHLNDGTGTLMTWVAGLSGSGPDVTDGHCHQTIPQRQVVLPGVQHHTRDESLAQPVA